jgi:hypothetical protein
MLAEGGPLSQLSDTPRGQHAAAAWLEKYNLCLQNFEDYCFLHTQMSLYGMIT